MFKNKITVLFAVAFLAGCAAIASRELNDRYGPPDPARYDRTVAVSNGIPDYRRDVRPILERRCVSCHACYDAPCQLNLNSYAGVTRGTNKSKVYDGARVLAAAPTRLFTDAQSTVQWRKLEFNSVLNERTPSLETNRDLSVLYRSLTLKRTHPLPPGAVLPADKFDMLLTKPDFCPRIEEMADYEKAEPLAGMPYALPQLSDAEHNLLARWIEAGAPDSGPKPLTDEQNEHVNAWEQFLNGDSLKEQLMSRYIYEHWVFGHLYFDDLKGPSGNDFFQLVRSRTPPGKPLDLIATRRPYDDPGVARVYYRLRRFDESSVAKTQLPLALNAARITRLRAWFLDAPYAITKLPGYAPELASNPFATFRELPDTSRYRFMLDDAQFMLGGFIKGPVCRGQVSLNVINDHFWVVFVNPDALTKEDMQFVEAAADKLRFPAEKESSAGVWQWITYARNEADYLRFKAKYVAERFGASHPPSLKLLWDGSGIGDKSNPNAALTVYRHFDSATVIQGLWGERPQTALLLGFPTFERIHYLLVAGFDVYGNVGHQLSTRLYFDFLRMESELGIIAMLPRANREAAFDYWYRDADKRVVTWFRELLVDYRQETGERYTTADPLTELYARIKRRYAGLAPKDYALDRSALPRATLQTLQKLPDVPAQAATLMPELALLTITTPGGKPEQFTLLRDSAHNNVATPFKESDRRLYAEDRLQILRGVIGAYPNAFFEVPAGEVPAFAAMLRGMVSESDYTALMDRYGIRRTDSRFWAHSDALHADYFRIAPRDSGWLDYSRLENR